MPDKSNIKININDDERITYALGNSAGRVTVRRVGGRTFARYTRPDDVSFDFAEVLPEYPLTFGRSFENRIAPQLAGLSREGNRIAFDESGNLILTTTEINSPVAVSQVEKIEPDVRAELKLRPKPPAQEIETYRKREYPLILKQIAEIDHLLGDIGSSHSAMEEAQRLAEATQWARLSQINKGAYRGVALEGYRDLLRAYKLLKSDTLNASEVTALDQSIAALDDMAKDETLWDIDKRVSAQVSSLEAKGERCISTGHMKHAIVVRIEKDNAGYMVTTFNAGDEALRRLPAGPSGGTIKPKDRDHVVVMRRQRLKPDVPIEDFIRLLDKKKGTWDYDPTYPGLREEVENSLEPVDTEHEQNYRFGPQQHKGDCSQRSSEELTRTLLGTALQDKVLVSISRQSAEQELQTPEQMVQELNEIRARLNRSLPLEERLTANEHEKVFVKQDLEKLDVIGDSNEQLQASAEAQIGKILSTGKNGERIQEIRSLVKYATGREMMPAREETYFIGKYAMAAREAKKNFPLLHGVVTPTPEEVTKAAIEQALAHHEMKPKRDPEILEIIFSNLAGYVRLLDGDFTEITQQRIAEISNAREARSIIDMAERSGPGQPLEIRKTEKGVDINSLDKEGRDEVYVDLYNRFAKLGIEAKDNKKDLVKATDSQGKYLIGISADIAGKLRFLASLEKKSHVESLGESTPRESFKVHIKSIVARGARPLPKFVQRSEGAGVGV